MNLNNLQVSNNDPKPSGRPGDGVELSQEQSDAVQQIVSTDKPVTILTGPAGCGKSTITNYLRQGVGFCVAATTGKAAMHIDGVTVDSLFCFNRNNWKIWSDKFLEYLMSQVPDRIIIDEASMIGRNMGDVIHEVAQDYKKQLLLVGDFAQARPVKDDWITKSRLLDDYNFLRLTECHRQEEGQFLQALNRVRVGEINQEVTELFGSRVRGAPPDDDSWVRMFATNKKTETYNQAKLWQHVKTSGAPHFRLFSAFKDERSKEKQEDNPRAESYIEREIESSRLADRLDLAIGARVVLTVNCSLFGQGTPYVNGDTGTLVDGTAVSEGMGSVSIKKAVDAYNKSGQRFRVESLRVKLDRTGHTATIMPVSREVKSAAGTLQHKIVGFPINLGYALTIHKAQGMTVPRAWLDMDSLMRFPDRKSRHGLAYVGLSRTTSLEGLLISRWVPQAVYCDPAIRELL